MCWPEIVGGVEIEERRPRNWNEPRRKRLNFVRSHGRISDEWVPTPRRLTEQEQWDRQRAQAMEQRFMHHVPHPQFPQFQGQFQGHFDPRMVQMPHAGPHFRQIQPGQHGHQPRWDQHGHQGHQPQLDRHSHHSDDDIVRIEDYGHDGHDDHDGHDGHDHLEPRIIHLKPPKSHLPKGLRAHAKKSGHKKKHSVSSSSSDDSSPDRYSGFSEGFRAGRRSLSRGPVPRGRSRSRLTDDSFEDLMHQPLRSGSRRGRRF